MRRAILPLFLLTLASSLSAQSLTGTWSCNDGGTYYIRQAGTEVWWYGRSADGAAFTNVFRGHIDNGTIRGDWADVPPGATQSFGELALRIESNRHLVATRRTGNFSGSEWTRGEGGSRTSNPPDGGGGGGVRGTKPPSEYRGQNGLRLTYDCAPGANGVVWGTDVYTDDSNICSAGMHAGVIGRNGGSVTIEIRPGQRSYHGSARNGVETNDYGQFVGSYSVVGGNAGVQPPRGGGRGEVVPADTAAYNYRGQTGKRLIYDCPPNPGGSVWGTDVYTDDSTVCRAAVHAGVIGNGGGRVEIEIEIAPGQSSYRGTERNGVSSSDYGSWVGSFRFVEQR